MKMFNWNCLKCVAMSIFNVHLIKRFINGSRARLSRLSENEATRIRLKFCVIAIGYQYRVMQLAWGERRKLFVSMRTAETEQKEAKENAKSFSTHFAKRNDSAEECHNATLLMSMCVCVCRMTTWCRFAGTEELVNTLLTRRPANCLQHTLPSNCLFVPLCVLSTSKLH